MAERGIGITEGHEADTTEKRPVLCRLHLRNLTGPVNLVGLSEVFSRLEGVSILGGNCAKAGADGFSYFASGPREVFEFRAGEEAPLAKLEEALGRYRLNSEDLRRLWNEIRCDGQLPGCVFCGGWIGYFGYELGRYIERVPERAVDDLQMPLIRLCFYDRLICVDHIAKRCRLMALEIAGDSERVEDKLDGLERLASEAERVSVRRLAAGRLERPDFSQVRCNMEKDYYLETVEKIRRYIYDGDVYQVNFSQRFESAFGGRGVELFHWQNIYNPSGYAAYIDGGEFQIVSASPEMFVTICDGVISTKPIKGTRRRLDENGAGGAAARMVNYRNFNELARSEKEQAELNMIIDLERNDLGRICEYGTIKVVQPRTIESYPTVFHAVATIEGKQREEISFCDVLRAMFPGGSITGAPKVASMEIIDETEPTARGVYTGGIGYIGIEGTVCLNIAIRTIIVKAGKAYAQVGGGIVADSDAEAEWEETLTKARALLAGIRSVQQARNICRISSKDEARTWGAGTKETQITER